MAHPHDVFLKRLKKAGDIRLVARLADSPLVQGLSEKFLYVFVPDLHLVSAAMRQRYAYGFDWAAVFKRLTTALLGTGTELRGSGRRLRVVQLGDFVDLWRESNNDPIAVKQILDSFPDMRDRFLRNAPGSVGAMLTLGNHDLEARQSRAFARARTTHYLPGARYRVLATHGDAFDIVEQLVPDQLASFAVKAFGRLAKPNTYPMGKLRALRDATTTPATNLNRIQGDCALPDLRKVGDAALPKTFNVTDVHLASKRKRAHGLLPNVVRTVEALRTKKERDGKPSAPNLSVVVHAHTHHARLVADHKANFVLMDCGGWVESYESGGRKRPNRQVAAICGSDLRIYQID